MIGSRAAWGVVASLVLAAAVGGFLWPQDAGDSPDPSFPGDTPVVDVAVGGSEVGLLREELAAARTRNAELSAEVDFLRVQLRVLGENSQIPTPPREAGEDPGLEADESGDSPQRRWFDADALLAAEIPPHEVERLRETFDASEMDLIELEHQSVREGWNRTPRYWTSLREMRVGLREDLGDDGFDLLLFATGRANRVVIEDVLAGSPGEQAGLQAGDVVIRYDTSRIFKPGELKRQTTAGELGERVSIDVLRGDEHVRIHSERGPIGVKLRAARRLPETR